MFSLVTNIVSFVGSILSIVQFFSAEQATECRVAVTNVGYAPASRSIDSWIVRFIDQQGLGVFLLLCGIVTVAAYRHVTALFEILTIFAFCSIVLTLIAVKARYLVLDRMESAGVTLLHLAIFVSIMFADRSMHPSLSNFEELMKSAFVLLGFLLALFAILSYMKSVAHAALHCNGEIPKRAYLHLLLCALFAFFLCDKHTFPFLEMLIDFLAEQSANMLA